MHYYKLQIKDNVREEEIIWLLVHSTKVNGNHSTSNDNVILFFCDCSIMEISAKKASLLNCNGKLCVAGTQTSNK